MRLLILICLLIPCISSGQALQGQELKHYQKISKRSRSAPHNYSFSSYYLANYLTAPTISDLEKARSIYVWMANNITYDMKGFKSGNLPDYRPKAVLKTNIAVCEGYARLFNELCHEAGIESEIIRGYSKGYGYLPGNTFSVSNHAWNAVYLNGRWNLVDVTWAARRTNDTDIIRPLNNNYFLVEPSAFIADHLPEIPAWQLLSAPVSKNDFEQDSIRIIVGNFNYQDSLSLLLSMNSTKKAITYQLQAREFNPNNDETNYTLAAEYRFRALDSLEAVYDVTERDTSRFSLLQEQVFADLDEAALYFTLIKPDSRYFESSQVFLDDTDFERGVFMYETAHRILEIYGTFSSSKKEDLGETYEDIVKDYYQKAAGYFELIPTTSWYYEEAQNYLKFYLENPFDTL